MEPVHVTASQPIFVNIPGCGGELPVAATALGFGTRTSRSPTRQRDLEESLASKGVSPPKRHVEDVLVLSP